MLLSLNGKKISKSLGNVVAPKDLVEKYGVDPVRYYFLRYGPIVEDSDFSETHFQTVYNADLANGLGNTVARLAKLADKSGFSFAFDTENNSILSTELAQYFDIFRVDLALQHIWSKISDLDKKINEEEPWGIKDSEKLKEVLQSEIEDLILVAKLCKPFMPETSEKIIGVFKKEKITAIGGLFPRI